MVKEEGGRSEGVEGGKEIVVREEERVSGLR